MQHLNETGDSGLAYVAPPGMVLQIPVSLPGSDSIPWGTAQWLEQISAIEVTHPKRFSWDFVIKGTMGADASGMEQPVKWFQLKRVSHGMGNTYDLIETDEMTHLATFRCASDILCSGFACYRCEYRAVEFPPGNLIAETRLRRPWFLYSSSSWNYLVEFITPDGREFAHISQPIKQIGSFFIVDISGRHIGSVDINVCCGSPIIRISFAAAATPFDRLMMLDFATTMADRSFSSPKIWLYLLLVLLIILIPLAAGLLSRL